MVTRTDPDKHREQVRAANRARYRAVQALIDAHRPEFDVLYAREAAIEGVQPKPRQELDAAQIKGQIEQLKTKLRELDKKDSAKS